MKWLLLLLLSLLAGCGAKRESVSQQAESREQITGTADSLRMRTLTLRQDRKRWVVRQVRMLSPDTAGRQYVESVTTWEAGEQKEEERMEEMVSVSDASDENRSVETETVSRSKAPESRISGGAAWVLVAGICFFTGSFLRRK